jgi:hypothetical protein
MGSVPPFHFAVPVWGESHVKTFLECSLPAQLSSANIPALLERQNSLYTIFTTHEDYIYIEASPAYRALQRAIPVSTEFIDLKRSASAGTKYKIKSDCYRRALLRGAESGAAVVALNADIVLANGFVSTVSILLAEGKRVVEVPGPRGLQKPIADVLMSRFRGPDNISISIEPAQLADLWLKNLHPQLEMHFVDGRKGDAFHPSHLYWRVGDEGVIIRGFHLYPIVVYPRESTFTFSGTIDDDLIASANFDREERHVVVDSRRLFCCELSPLDVQVGRIADRGNLRRYIEFYSSFAESNIENLHHAILITGKSELGPEWRKRIDQSEKFVHSIVREYRARQRYQKTVWGRAKSACRRILRRLKSS